MYWSNLRTLDLNLLTALDALIELSSVTAAAERLGLTQSAMSRTLGRLRAVFDDPLLTRTGRRMVLTPRAEELRGPLRRILEEVRYLVQPRAFDPAAAQGTIRINAPDAATFLALPGVFRAIAQQAPSLDIRVLNTSIDRLPGLGRGDFDLLIDAVGTVAEPFRIECLATGRFLCLVRNGHPIARTGLSQERYAELPHVAIDVASTRILDETLAGFGVRRRCALTIPNFLIAAEVVSKTDWVLTVPQSFTERLLASFPLTCLDFPFSSPVLTLDMVWHKRSHYDPAHIWLRQQVQDNVAYGG